MVINRSDYIFAFALEAQIDVIFKNFQTKGDKSARIQKWKRYLSLLFSKNDRERFKTIYSISLFDKIEIIVSSNNFHVKHRLFFENRSLNYWNFKRLLFILAADYRHRYYDEEEFLTFCTEIVFLGWIGYQECKQVKVLRYASCLVLYVLQGFREKSQFNVYSYSRLNEWAKNTMEPFNNCDYSDIESHDLTLSPEESSGDSEVIETQNSKESPEESDAETQYSEETSDSKEVKTESLKNSSVDSRNVEIHSSKEAFKDSRKARVRCAFSSEPSTSYNPPDRTACFPLHQLRSDPMHPKLDFRSHTDVRRQNILRRQSFNNFCINTAVPVNPSTSYNPPDRTASVPLHQIRSDPMYPKFDFQSHIDVWRQNRSQNLSNFCSITGKTTDTYKDEEEKPLDLSARTMNLSAKKESSSRIGDFTRDSDSAIEKKDASSPKTSHDA